MPDRKTARFTDEQLEKIAKLERLDRFDGYTDIAHEGLRRVWEQYGPHAEYMAAAARAEIIREETCLDTK